MFNENTKKIETLKDKSSNLNVLENVFTDDDVNSFCVKSSSVPEIHDNTNDSYTSTVSRMDDSFKSAITHFEECVQKTSEPVEILHNSLNKTLDGDESLLNDTLKNHSICSSEKLTATFEVCTDQTALDYNCNSESGDANLLEEELIKSQHVEENVEMKSDEIIGGLELTEENLKQFEGQNPKNAVSDITVEDKVTSQTVNLDEKTDCLDIHSLAVKEKDEDVLSHISAANQFCASSVFSEGNEDLVTPRVEDLKENISTSTVVLFKAEHENVDATAVANNDCESFSSCEEPVVVDKLKNSREPNDKDIETIYSGREFSEEERPEIILNSDKTMVKELFTKDIEEVSVADNIPLASQKSYTVLHNVNSNLDRPVVLDSPSDVGELNDIILGNTNFSDLSVICDEGGHVEAANSSDALVENYCKEKEEILTKTGNLGIFNNMKVSNEVVDAKTQEFDTLTQSDFRSSFCEINQCEKENFDPNLGLLDNLEKPKSDTILTSMHNSSNKKFEKKSESDVKTLAELESSNHLEKCNNTPKSALRAANAVNRSLAETSVGPLDENSSGNNTFTKESHTNCEEIYTALNNPTPIRRSDSPSNIECILHDIDKQKMNDSLSEEPLCNTSFEFNNNPFETFARLNDSLASADENSKRSPVLDTELTQLIQEQFTPTDIEKICCVVDDMPELNLSKNILIASHLFDKSFQDKTLRENDKEEFCNDNGIFAGLDYLESIKGKPGRDLSRESLYTKFDPLLQPKISAELFDISEGDKENLNISISATASEPLIPISPLKETVNVTAPSPQKLSAEKLNKLRELQDEISLLRESYQQKEEQNKERMNNYENEILKMTAKVCHLQEKLKESEETEKSLVKKLNSHNESVNRLKGIVEEYFSYIEKLTGQIETAKMERKKQVAIITEERDYYMNHLQSTEQAFSDVHSKYEKCKKAVELYKKNEEMYRASIDDLKERVEHYSEKIKEIQENAAREVGRLQEKMSDLKYSHAQEISRYKAQLRKTEIKVQSIQEALDQKVKENQELAGICDELIEGKKCGR